MRSDEARIGEAISSLRARLSQWGVDDADARAAAFVTDMLHQGWRPRALPSQPPPVSKGGCDPNFAAENIKAIRAELAKTRAEIARARATSKETRDE